MLSLILPGKNRCYGDTPPLQGGMGKQTLRGPTKQKIINLPVVGQINDPHQGNTFLLCSSQQLPCLGLITLKAF